MFLSQLDLRILPLDDSQSGGGGEEGVDLVLLDQPEVLSSVRRPVRLAFVHERRVSVDEGRVADVRVSHHPAHVGRRPPHFVRTHPVNGPHRPGQHRGVATGRTSDALIKNGRC